MNAKEFTAAALVVLSFSTVANPTPDQVTTYYATTTREAVGIVSDIVAALPEGESLHHVTMATATR